MQCNVMLCYAFMYVCVYIHTHFHELDVAQIKLLPLSFETYPTLVTVRAGSVQGAETGF